MKILLSAYACEPDKGSEPGVGWSWAEALVRQGHQVHVITRSNNRPEIERTVGRKTLALRFDYYDLGRLARAWKHWPGGIYLYYLLWQLGAYRLARRLHEKEKFDCVQHITFVSFRQPSFMGLLGIPFIFGPVGGGETMPAALQKGIPWTGRIAETVRGIGNALVRWDPFMAITFSHAHLIACTSPETLARIPRRYRSRCRVQLAIGIRSCEIETATRVAAPGPQFLFVGRLLYWKGLHLALRALAEVRRVLPKATLKIIGQGPDRDWLASVAREAGVENAVEWVPAAPHSEIPGEFHRSTALVFPSLHDSGGMVVLESLAAGVPVVCLDLGGPGAIVDSSCGVAIKTAQVPEEAIVKSLAEVMILLASNPRYRAQLSAGALARARQMTWDRAAETVYSQLEARRG